MAAAPRVPSGATALTASTIDGAPRWVSGVLAGLQAALLSFLVVSVPALAAYVATSADPSNEGVGWSHSVAIGGALWLMGHGAVLRTEGAVVSIVPLGLTALALFACYASARRSAHRAASAWLAGVGGYTATVALAALLVGPVGPLGAGGASLARTAVGAVLVSAVGIGAGLVRVRRLRERTRRWWSTVHPFVRSGATAGAMVVALVVGAASLVTSTWVVSSRAATGDVVAGLGVDTFGGLLLALAQLAVLPNLVLWVMAWLVGPGFSVGAGTVYSPDSVIAGPVPALPLLGALPVEGSEGGLVALAPLAVVAAGTVAGWWLHGRLATSRGWHPWAAAAATATSTGVFMALLTALAGGSAGPGRLADVGGPVAVVGLVATGLTFVGVALALVPTDAVVRAASRRRAGALWAAVTGRSRRPQTPPDRVTDVPPRRSAPSGVATPAADVDAGPGTGAL